MEDTHDASTTSRPQGEIEADPTGLSTSNDQSFSNVGLAKADAGSTVFDPSISRVNLTGNIDIKEKQRAQFTADSFSPAVCKSAYGQSHYSSMERGKLLGTAALYSA